MTDTSERQADAIEQDILETQNTISDTVEQLQQRLSPHALVQSIFGDESEGSDRIVAMAKRNPFAVALIGAGALMLASGKSPSMPSLKRKPKADGLGRDDHHRGYVEHMAQITPQHDEPDHLYQRRRDIARSNYFMVERNHDEDDAGFRKRLDDMGEALRSRTSAFGGSVRKGGGKLADGIRGTGESARNAGGQAYGAAQRMYGDNPVIGGLVAASLGAIAGALIPESRMEREKLAPLGKAAAGKASEHKDKAVEAIHAKVEEVAPQPA